MQAIRFMKIVLVVLCGASFLALANDFDQVLLIINYNHPYYQTIPFLKKIYGPTFKNIVFYGPEEHPGVNFCPHYKGYFSYITIAQAMQQYADFKGYLFLHDDCILNTSLLGSLNLSRIWVPEVEFGAGTRGAAIDIRQDDYPQWGWWATNCGRDSLRGAFKMLPAKAKLMLAENWGYFSVAYGYSDIAYIPAQYRTDYQLLCAIMAKNKAFLELALPTMIGCLCPKREWVFLPGQNGCKNLTEFRKDLLFNHPVKLSSAENRAFVEVFLCEKK